MKLVRLTFATFLFVFLVACTPNTLQTVPTQVDLPYLIPTQWTSTPIVPSVATKPPPTLTLSPTVTKLLSTPTITPSPKPTRPFLITPTRNNLFPFVLPWDDSSVGITNISVWLSQPAGAKGYVTERDGHLYIGNEQIRFFGTNVTFSTAFPKHEDADKIAARMAKFGINAVRFHHMDTQPAPNGLLQKDAKTIDPDQLDRLDYFIAQLKKNGIYADLNLHVGRLYPEMPKWDTMPQYFKGIDNFFAPMIALQQDYARALLTHRNPYTQFNYLEDPAVAFIEINNENGLMREWWNGSLDDPSMPALYSDELTRQWREWLKKKYGSALALKQSWGVLEEPLGLEMLTNGDLLQNAQGWFLQLVEGAQATAQTTNEGPNGMSALRIQVQQVGKEAWHVQLYEPKRQVLRDKPYTLTFWAKADAPRTLQVNLMQAHDPWQHLWDTNISLTKEWQYFKFVLSPSDSDENARVTFTNLGAQVGTTWFAQVSLKPGGMLGLQPNESLETLNFTRKTEFSSRTPEAQRDWLRFLWETEDQYWKRMYQYVKRGLGAKALVIGTQVSYSPAPIQAQFDVVDGHAYWQHPRFPGQPWDPVNWFITNTPMAGTPDGGTLPGLALRRVTGKPFIVSEYNHAAPNTFSSEAFLLVSAYAALQDWDGVFEFDYGNNREDWNAQRMTGYFAINQHPTKLVTLPVAAALFRRVDVQAPTSAITAGYDFNTAIDQMRKSGPILGADTFGSNRLDALSLPISLALSGKPSPSSKVINPPGVIVSDNRQLTWDTGNGKGFVTINTTRSKAFIGYVNKRVIDLGDVRITPGTTLQDWCAITLTTIDASDFKSSGHWLITATGYLENTEMGWKNPEKSTVGKDWGKAPTLVEGISATITLSIPGNRVKVWSLDEYGRRIGAIPVQDVNSSAFINLDGKYGTLWYEVEVQ